METGGCHAAALTCLDEGETLNFERARIVNRCTRLRLRSTPGTTAPSLADEVDVSVRPIASNMKAAREVMRHARLLG